MLAPGPALTHGYMAGSCVSTRPQDSCYFIHQALPLH